MTVESSMPSGVNFGLRNKMAFGRINIPDRRISELSEAEYLQPELLEVLQCNTSSADIFVSHSLDYRHNQPLNFSANDSVKLLTLQALSKPYRMIVEDALSRVKPNAGGQDVVMLNKSKIFLIQEISCCIILLGLPRTLLET